MTVEEKHVLNDSSDVGEPLRISPAPPRPRDRQDRPCFHGGASFDGIGTGFDDLSRRHDVINADVLDAWFDPAPGVVIALREHLSWLIRTSPPVQASGMVSAIAAARGVPAECLVPGAGSSDLIYRAFSGYRPDCC